MERAGDEEGAAGEQPTSICALPLYHIFAFTVNMMLSMRMGSKTLLIPNPRDLPAVLKELSKQRFHSFPAVNTLFNGLANHPTSTPWTGATSRCRWAAAWLCRAQWPSSGWKRPVVRSAKAMACRDQPFGTCNPVTVKEFSGTIGVPLPSTLSEAPGRRWPEVTTLGQPGEIAIRARRSWRATGSVRTETAKVMTEDGFFKSGDVG